MTFCVAELNASCETCVHAVPLKTDIETSSTTIAIDATAATLVVETTIAIVHQRLIQTHSSTKMTETFVISTNDGHRANI